MTSNSLLLSENPSLILTSHALAHKSPNFSATFIFSEKHQTIGESGAKIRAFVRALWGAQ